ncbi:MAG: WYL domain-containing protein, partial [Dermatophilaceae bacterium]|nr:WYL domain-containing protein [Dermatophilaceae bacterium]
GPVKRKGRAGSYVVPSDHVPEVALEAQPPEPVGTAVVRVRHGRGHTLRRNAVRTTELDERWAEIEVPYQRGTTERDVVALGTHAVAVAPPELVAGVRSALQAVADAHDHGDRQGVTHE